MCSGYLFAGMSWCEFLTTLHNARNRDPPGQRQDDHRVATSDADFEGVVIVAVDDPLFVGGQFKLSSSPLFFWRIDPARLLVPLIEVIER